MRFWPRLRQVWRQLVHGRQVERELDDELAAYVSLAADERARGGVAADEARRRVLAESGGLQQIKEQVRDVRSTSFVDPLMQDVRHAFRQMRRAPAFTAAALSAIALGIGASTAMFSVVEAVLLRPLAYRDAHELVAVLHDRTDPVAPANFLDWRQQAKSFSSMAAAEFWTPNLGGSAPEKVFALRVTPDLLPQLGVAPALGRFPGAGPEALTEAVIGSSLWQRQFAADPGAIGRSIQLDGTAYTVVGVMPASFKFAPFWATRAELWAPLDLTARATSRTGNSLRVFARLAPGVGLDAARDEIAAITARLEREFPGTNRRVEVTPLREMVVGDIRRPILAVFAAVAFVLLVACANVAHMLLARASSREREVAVRAALGADRGRLVRQFLTESVILGLAGGIAGLGLAYTALQFIVAIAAPEVPRIDSVALNGAVLAVALATSVITGVIFGLAPAIRARRPDLTTTLKEGERGSTVGRGTLSRRGWIIATEIAFASVLLIGTGMMIRSFAALRAVDPGWVPDRVLSMAVSVAGSAEAPPGRRTLFYQEALARVRTLPGVEAVSAINHLPLAGDIWGTPFTIDGQPAPAAGDTPRATFRVVLPGYFDTVGLPILRGRDFTDRDDFDTPAGVIVNQSLVDTYFGGEDVVAAGRRLRFDGEGTAPIIGVVKNAAQSDWASPPSPELYVAYLRNRMFRESPRSHATFMTFVVRTSGDPAPATASVRRTIQSLAPDVTISDVLLMRDLVTQATAGARFLLTLMTAFGVVALVLAAVGVYGVMSYVVAGRRHEIGIRLALGASPRGVLWQVVKQGLVIAAIGTATGLVLAAGMSRLVAGVLYGVEATDAVVFTIAPMALVFVAALASFAPAWRASRVDPVRELR
ncbi:MAG TPA: ABC transporter permease [Vicinamibacterales bacterium]|nr:ABC transporter permease [Vicinamibacterales bacterium]